MSTLFKGKLFAKGKKQEKSKNNSGSNKVKKVLSKISGAFMLPISVMAIGGLFLGIGAAISSNAGQNESLRIFGEFITQLGNPIFYSLPLLFAVAFVIAFTDEAGVAVFATIIGYLVFVSIQSVFIFDQPASQMVNEDTNILQSGKDWNITIGLLNDAASNKTYLSPDFANLNISVVDGHLVINDNMKVLVDNQLTDLNSLLTNGAVVKSVDFVTTTGQKLSAVVSSNGTNVVVNKTIEGYKVLFGGAGRDPQSLSKLVGYSLGVKSLQTSVFGGIAVGLVMQYLYVKLHTIKLPAAISFFGGKRFVALAAVPAMTVLAFLFLIFWPWVGYGLSKFGSALGSAKYVDSFIFGYVERALVPFGLHHVFYATLWYTPVGGDVDAELTNFVNAVAQATKENKAADTIIHGMKLADAQALIASDNFKSFQNFVTTNANVLAGDSTISLNIIKYEQNTIGDIPVFDFLANQLGIRVGRFMDGKFSIMMFALPAAAVAMVYAAPKENRKVTLGTVLPAGLTSLITGVTEPIEFTFLFLSPLLFWGFHAFMAATSFLVANLMSVHIPMAFSGGLLDMLIYGAVNVQKGTHFWWPLVVGPAYSAIYFGFFLWYIKYKNLDTPGRGGNTKLFTKADFKAAKANEGGVDQQALNIVLAMGGLDNITAFNNCASRLRYDVKDKDKVSVDKLKAAGAFGVQFVGEHHVQAIFGPAAEQINAKINSQRQVLADYLAKNQELTQSDEFEAVNEAVQASEQPQTYEELINPVTISTVARGKIIPMNEVADPVFSSKAMGDGFAVQFDAEKTGNVYSPVEGEITLVFPTKHAYGIKTKEDVQILVHIGINTVSLQGEGFTPKVQTGDKVKAGDLLAEVDLELIKEKGLVSDPVVIILNEGKHNQFEFTNTSMKADTTTTEVGQVK
ncbi:glucose PTS transporter subunit IIA [Mycoplasma hafezii]|uniref:PTS transporter subunit IIABC n=1 Tax=Mycoplasma hafezii TaxID=525886 RepID=UPI003CF16846